MAKHPYYPPTQRGFEQPFGCLMIEFRVLGQFCNSCNVLFVCFSPCPLWLQGANVAHILFICLFHVIVCFVFICFVFICFVWICQCSANPLYSFVSHNCLFLFVYIYLFLTLPTLVAGCQCSAHPIHRSHLVVLLHLSK